MGTAWLEGWLDAWLPPRCVAWDQPLSARPRADTERRPRAAPGPFCADAQSTLRAAEPALDEATGAWASFLFGGALRDAVVAAKYLPDERRARRLARFWGETLQVRPLPLSSLEQAAVVFVPAHWRRRLRRGFDFAPLLADAFAAHAGRPVIDALRCVRHEAPLSAASTAEEREARAADRYTLRVDPARLPEVIILVDDVVTTGATLSAARAPLEAAGKRVVPVAFARTPL